MSTSVSAQIRSLVVQEVTTGQARTPAVYYICAFGEYPRPQRRRNSFILPHHRMQSPDHEAFALLPLGRFADTHTAKQGCTTHHTQHPPRSLLIPRETDACTWARKNSAKVPTSRTSIAASTLIPITIGLFPAPGAPVAGTCCCSGCSGCSPTIVLPQESRWAD